MAKNEDKLKKNQFRDSGLKKTQKTYEYLFPSKQFLLLNGMNESY